MKLLISGRNGQVARSLAERAAGRKGIELHFAARPEVDLERPGEIAKAIAEIRPDVVINAAAYTDVDRAEDEPTRAYRINAEAAGEAAEAAATVGAAIIQLSTDYVFDGQGRAPYREDDATGPVNSYGTSKLAGEEAVRAANPRHLILRTAWLVGPYGRNFVHTMLRLAAGRDEIKVVADQIGCPTDTLSLADAILTVAERWSAGDATGIGETFHVAGGGACSWADFATRIMTASAVAGGPSARILPIPATEHPTRARRPAFSVLDTNRFEQAFAFAPTPWPAMTDRLVARLVTAQGSAS